MNFSQVQESVRVDATTNKGNFITFITVNNDKLKTCENILDEDHTAWNEATRIKIECSFEVTTTMAELLESSKILYVEDVDNFITGENENIISTPSLTIVPRPLFDFEKLKNVLFDLCQKFDL